MKSDNLNITKTSGEVVRFSLHKLRSSLKRTGAEKKATDYVTQLDAKLDRHSA